MPLLLNMLSHFSCVWLFMTLWTVACQAPLSMGFSRQEHWSGLPFPSPMHESEKWKWSRSVVSNPQRPHGLQPSRLLHPWDFPGKSTGVSALASFLPKKSQGWSPSEWTNWISLQSKGLSRVFSNTTVQKHQFLGTQPSSQSNSHIHTWPLEKP